MSYINSYPELKLWICKSACNASVVNAVCWSDGFNPQWHRLFKKFFLLILKHTYQPIFLPLFGRFLCLFGSVKKLMEVIKGNVPCEDEAEENPVVSAYLSELFVTTQSAMTKSVSTL